MKRYSLILLLLPLLVLSTLMAGCTNSERFGRLIVTSDLSTRYIVALETQTTQQAFIEFARAPVGVDRRVIFTHLPPGEYRLEVYDDLNTIVFTSLVFGVSTIGDSRYALTTSLPP